MALMGPSAEDQRKLHSEVNQLVNQRFQLTTLAITVFGVVMAWLLPRDNLRPGDSVGTLIFGGSILLLILLFVIFLFARLLAVMLRVITTYLVVTSTSGWEADWARYREQGAYVGCTRPQSIVFAVLGTLTTAFLYVTAWAYSLHLEPRGASYLLLVAGILYLSAVGVLGFINTGIREPRARRKWEALKREDSA